MTSDAPEPKPPTVRIPPPPPRVGKRRKGGSHRGFVWVGALALGIGLGVVAYRWIPNVDFYFDYWVALALG